VKSALAIHMKATSVTSRLSLEACESAILTTAHRVFPADKEAERPSVRNAPPFPLQAVAKALCGRPIANPESTSKYVFSLMSRVAGSR
jgi:hypothetical protein